MLHDSIEFIRVLKDFGFSIGDWEFLETLLKLEGVDITNIETIRLGLEEIVDRYNV